MLKQMVMSETYRQSSQPRPADAAARSRQPVVVAPKPLPARRRAGPRRRAWRSAACFPSEIGGPSVKPYQPPGYWVFLNFPRREYHADQGTNQYRRGLYTYWQRTFLHPSLLAFDASTREECVVQRPRSNTPLQALVLLNDPTYVEAARAWRPALIREGGTDPATRLDRAFRLTLSRPAAARGGPVLMSLLTRHDDTVSRPTSRGACLARHRRCTDPRRSRSGRARGLDVRRARSLEPARDHHPELTPWTLSRSTISTSRIHRRTFLRRSTTGLGTLALASLLDPNLLHDAERTPTSQSADPIAGAAWSIRSTSPPGSSESSISTWPAARRTWRRST